MVQNGKISFQERPSCPPQSARFDISFEGPKIKGAIKGTDYLTVRSDGAFMLDIFATITTEDGEQIPLREQGTVIPLEEGKGQLQLTLRFLTAIPKYVWLNSIQAWALGNLDMEKGTFEVLVFTGNPEKVSKAA